MLSTGGRSIPGEEVRAGQAWAGELRPKRGASRGRAGRLATIARCNECGRGSRRCMRCEQHNNNNNNNAGSEAAALPSGRRQRQRQR
jgi:hypothetical protein